MKKRTSITKFKSSSTSYGEKHGAAGQLTPTSDQADEDDESGGGHGKGKLGSYKLEKLLGVIGKGTFKANQFGNFLNKVGGLDTSTIKETELSKETKEEAKKTAAEDKAIKVSEDSLHAQDINSTKKESNTLDKTQVDEKQATRYGLFGENNGYADHQGKIIQTEIGLAASERAVASLGGSSAAGSIATAAAGLHGNTLGIAKQTGMIGRFNVLHNAAAEKGMKSGEQALPAAESQTKNIGRR